MTLRLAHIGVVARFQPAAARELFAATEFDFLVDEPLSQAELGQLALARRADSTAGFRTSVLASVEAICPALFLQPGLRLLSSAGATNPRRCAEATAQLLVEHQLENLPIAVIHGADLVERLEELAQAGCPLQNEATGQPLAERREEIIHATAWLGAAPVVAALEQRARLVLASATSVPTLVTAAAIDRFDWARDDWDRLAAASMTGHCLAAGAAMTWDWGSPNQPALPPVVPGYPIAELGSEGSVRLAKPPNSAGSMSRRTFMAWLASAAALETPDVLVDSKALCAEPGPQDQSLTLGGATGTAPADHYRATIGLDAGYQAAALLVCREEARGDRLAELVELLAQRMAAMNSPLEELKLETLSAGCVRLWARDAREASVDRFVDQISHWRELCPKDFGIAPVDQAPLEVKPLVSEWPTTVPKELIEVTVDCRPASDWV